MIVAVVSHKCLLSAAVQLDNCCKPQLALSTVECCPAHAHRHSPPAKINIVFQKQILRDHENKKPNAFHTECPGFQHAVTHAVHFMRTVLDIMHEMIIFF